MLITPQKGWRVGLKELWAYRELSYFFVWRDIKVRYKQTTIGALWAIFQPLAAMVIFTVFFGKFAKIPSDDIPYPVFVYVGLLLWNYFSFSLSHASESMISNSNIIQKVYFPRLLIPISSSLVGLVDFAVASVVLLGLMFFYHYSPSAKIIVYLPLLILITFLSSVGLGCFFASINVKYRDIRYAIPFFIQMFVFLTPVIYPLNMLSPKFKWLVSLNPMSGVIENARRIIFSNGPVDWNLLFISLGISVVLFIYGIMHFRKTERFFADII